MQRCTAILMREDNEVPDTAKTPNARKAAGKAAAKLVVPEPPKRRKVTVTHAACDDAPAKATAATAKANAKTAAKAIAKTAAKPRSARGKRPATG